MKKLILVLCLFLMPFLAQAIITTPASNSYDATGDVKHYDKAFVKVKNGGYSTLADGTVVVLDLTADDGITVGTSINLNYTPHCVLDSSCAKGSMCMCQVFGYKSNVLYDATTSTAVAGQRAFMGVNAAGYASQVSTNASALYMLKDLGTFLDTSTTSGTIEMFINTL